MTASQFIVADTSQLDLAAPSPARWRSALRPWAAGTALVLLTLLAYFPLIRAGFIWDDDAYVLNNLALRSLKGLWLIWSHPFHPITPQYYPFTFTTFWIEYHLWGLRPLGFHVDNVVLHTISSLVLWRLLRKLQIPGAWLAAAVFAIHPVNVESVAWVSERKNVLSGLLFLIALTSYLRWVGITRPAAAPAEGASRWWYVLSLFLFALALFSKTVASSLPAVVLLILYWKRGRVTWRDVFPLTPFFALGISLGALTSWLERTYVGADGPEWQFTIFQRCLIAGRDLCFYAQKIFWPSNLTFIYPRWVIEPHNLILFAFPAAAIAVAVALWLLRRRLGRGPLVAMLFFGGCLFPALGFVNLYPMRFSFVADHFQYMAGIGLIIVGVGGMTWLLRRFAPDSPAAGRIIGGGLLALLLVATFLRTGDFSGAKMLWLDTIAKNRGVWIAYNNLAAILMKEGHYEDAEQMLEASLAIKPDYGEARLNEADMDLLLKHDPASAIKKTRQVLAEFSGDHNLLDTNEQLFAWGMLVRIYNNQGDNRDAQNAYENLLVLAPGDLIQRRALALLLEHEKDADGALAQWEQIVQTQPANAEAHAHAALLLAVKGRKEDAAKELTTAQLLDPRYMAYTLTAPAQQ